ncbi:MAG: DNA pilot protein [Microviridae sp.]|nr:MAG: DNA pilot protein [Microviridae sp.]
MPYGLEMIPGAVLGYLNAEYADTRQISQAQELQAMQIRGQKEMGRFNQSLALENWRLTGPQAERQRMEQAGLNVGLMYSGAGGGGGVTQTAPGSVTGQQAPSGGGEIMAGMGMALQAAMQEAQIENIKAQTKKTEAETPTVQPLAEASIAEKGAGAELKNAQAEYQKIQNNVASTGIDSLKAQLKATADKAVQEALQASIQTGVDKDTAAARVTQAYLNNVKSTWEIIAEKAGIQNIEADTKLKGIQWKDVAVNVFNKTDINGKDWREYTLEEKKTTILDEAQKLKGQQFDYQIMKDALDKITGIFDTVADIVGGAIKAPTSIINKTINNYNPRGGRRP